ncbi:MAG: hypothetical protein J3K34DRAFT_425562 [Monoraphidium minutum]|nr:MAG: hypothetical protein J3K34DRAFT_425562 [Monoraphidium minutum]
MSVSTLAQPHVCGVLRSSAAWPPSQHEHAERGHRAAPACKAPAHARAHRRSNISLNLRFLSAAAWASRLSFSRTSSSRRSMVAFACWNALAGPPQGFQRWVGAWIRAAVLLAGHNTADPGRAGAAAASAPHGACTLCRSPRRGNSRAPMHQVHTRAPRSPKHLEEGERGGGGDHNPQRRRDCGVHRRAVRYKELRHVRQAGGAVAGRKLLRRGARCRGRGRGEEVARHGERALPLGAAPSERGAGDGAQRTRSERARAAAATAREANRDKRLF